MCEKWVGGPAVECWGGLFIFSSQSNGKKKKKFCRCHGPPKPLCGSAPSNQATVSIAFTIEPALFLGPNVTSSMLHPFVLTILAFIFILLYKWSSTLQTTTKSHHLHHQSSQSSETFSLAMYQPLLSRLLMLPERSWRPMMSSSQPGLKQECLENQCTISKMWHWHLTASTGGKRKAYLCYIF